MGYWQKEETMSLDEKKVLQGERLIQTVESVYKNVPFYKKKMQDMGIEPGDIKSIDDLSKLPFTTKQDLRDNYPYGLFAVPMEEVVRIHASSGTTGRPTVVGYTKNDIDMWADMVARCFTAYGVTKKDIVQVAYGYGLFTGGLGAHYGGEHLGATVVPISGGNTKKQIQLIEEFGSTVLACTPSYALYIGESMRNMGIDPRSTNLRVGIFGAEPWTEEMRAEIEDLLGIQAMNIYGLSEIMGPGVAFDCEEKNGLHVNEDHFVPEIIHPDTLEGQPYGKEGELVFTCVTKEALPLLRYRTRDLTSLQGGTCSCGRTLVRMGRITGRSDDMLIIRGVNVFPSQIESVILKVAEVAPHYVLIVERINNLDTLEVWVEAKEGLFTDAIKSLEKVEKHITSELFSLLGLHVKVKLVEPKTIERSEGKAKRIIDKRKK
ncbi:phenylacetate--CoA ligase family protein [Cellulosilyticum lentocellum]|uniref:Phenylacetate-coenzyme A ligase n=1 Tax=Cellulosilyticum lentocellum (strain ATCC 49066 / DSM 5427 / NCIMB 11756 / RHM5) TaxID=642492 RepID=F2JPF6_CELLD|nr:phenylacetate--CoA ligase [Cellulosilyticum lentocellum]ADZ82504.1 Phenylacetate--CoA ligase [Cellulosilyticum lentocellum DSM 5427]